jgi:allantoate deiminase
VVDGNRVWHRLQELAKHTARPGPGVTRLSFTAEDTRARRQIVAWMRLSGLKVWGDEWGNFYGMLGDGSGDGAVMVGSHIDSVPGGGAFDGVLGVVAGLECLDALGHHPEQLRRSVVLAVFAEEEGARFGMTLGGSRAAVDAVAREAVLGARDASGCTYREASNAAARELGLPMASGFDLGVQAMLELHIEQGAVLEQAGAEVGVVTAIAGIRQYLVRFTGLANHAGATPMSMRKDALAAAAEVVAGVEELPNGRGFPDTVATVGHMVVLPNAANVIPGEVGFTIDLRDPEGEVLARCAASCRQLVEAVARRRGLHCSITDRSAWEPVRCHPSLVEKLERACRGRGTSYRRIFSGAVHDAGVVAQLAPTGMLFVPSAGGRSHCPEEWTSPQAVAKGTTILYDVLAELARGTDW